MKKVTRRELFKGAAAVGVGGAALATGLKPAKAVPAVKISTLKIPAGSRVSKSTITLASCGPVRGWAESLSEDLGEEYTVEWEDA